MDRLQLEESAELNLLASVGNTYSLNKLQKAAVIQDRGHRKPWENGRSKRAHVANMTSYDEDPRASGSEDDEGDETFGIPEECVEAYVTYQSAKTKYKDQMKARGYWGDKSSGNNDGKSKYKGDDREDRIKQMKAKSFCSGCGRKGHWHRDAECPKNANKDAAVKEVEVCHHVPMEVYSLRHEGAWLLGITDTACAKSVAGTSWLQQYSDEASKMGHTPSLARESEAFRFGTGKVHYSSFYVKISFRMGSRVVTTKVSIINGDVPLLLSKKALAQLGMIYDVAANRADFQRVNLKGFEMLTTSSIGASCDPN